MTPTLAYLLMVFLAARDFEESNGASPEAIAKLDGHINRLLREGDLRLT